MLVVDASVAVRACAALDGFAFFEEESLVAPALMWSETRSALHQIAWRGDVAREDARESLERLEASPIARRDDPVGLRAWEIADELGLAKTYDAEYLALAELLGCRLVTLDARLRRRAERLGYVVGPAEL